jgi:hypothetical protein
MDNNDIKNITKMYDKLTYFDQYGGSLILFIIITIIVIVLVSYFHTMINIQPIIDDWPNQRCKPNIIPIAGFITHPEDMTASEYTFKNFNHCTQNILSGITGYSVEPLTYITNVLQTIAGDIGGAIQSIRALFDKIRTSMQDVSEEIMGRLLNTMIPLQQIIISFKDLISKIQGATTAGLFTLLGSYYTLKAFLGAFVQFIITILIALAIMIAIFWIVPFTWGAAIANTAIFVAIAIPLAIILTFMNDVLHINGNYQIPTLKCFDKDTIICMNDGSLKTIYDIQVGDVLFNNNIVTAKMKVITEGSQMYKLNDILVSDSHIINYNGNWILVSNHPNAIKYESYKEPFLYCLNTSNKVIEIKDNIFTDWDEIYDNSLNNILNNDNIYKNTTISTNNKDYIHKYLDCGFSSYSKIKLIDGTLLHINEIQPNDILENGEKVYGIVEINGDDLVDQYRYNLGEANFVEGFAPNLAFDKVILEEKHNKLYHLLTNKKTFKLENIIIPDYNDAIDRFLEINK